MFLTRTDDPKLEEAIACLTQALIDHSQSPEEVDKYSSALERLAKMRASRLSPDTVAMLIANLAGIGMILTHERVHVIATKALGFVLKR